MTFALAVAVTFVIGFVSLSYEVVWFRALSFVSGGIPAAFGVLLGYYLMGLAAGAHGSQRYCSSRTAYGDPVQLRALGGFVLLANVVGFFVLPSLVWFSRLDAWFIALVPIAASAALFGAVLPMISHFGIRPDLMAGARLSYLYLANILGCACGTVVTGFVLMDAWPLRGIALFLLLLGTGIAGVLLILGRGKHGGLRALLPALGVAVASVALAPRLFGQFYEQLLYKSKFEPEMRFADVVETRSGIITVTPSGVVFGGGVYDGVISTDLLHDRNGIVRAYALAAFHPHPREVLMVGLSAGAWAQVIAHMPGVEKVTIIEINPGYIQLIQKYPQVSSLLSQPKVEIVIDDGRRWLTRNPGRKFDLVVANTTFHWRAHSTNLLSREYVELVRAHLKPGGMYYFNTTESDEAMKTAMTVFPYGFRIVHFALVGIAPLRFEEARLRDVLGRYSLDGRPALDLSRPEGRARLDEIIAMFSLPERAGGDFETRQSVLHRLAGTGIVTDDNMLTEWNRPLSAPIWTPY